jgi:hypothetical protein
MVLKGNIELKDAIEIEKSYSKPKRLWVSVKCSLGTSND